MRRWRKKKQEDDDDILTFDGLEEEDEDEEDEEEEKPRRRYAAPRPIRTRFYGDEFDAEEKDEEDGPTFEELEPLIRAGKYKPKQKDPYTAHILYQNLRALGEI